MFYLNTGTCAFRPGSEIIQYAASHYVKNSLDPDEQLLDRRRVEYDIFLLVEELHVLGYHPERIWLCG